MAMTLSAGRTRAAGALPWSMLDDPLLPCLDSVANAWQAGPSLVHLPFDAMRLQYACAVQAGMVRNSMLASRDFEQAVDALEHLTLGPLARHV